MLHRGVLESGAQLHVSDLSCGLWMDHWQSSPFHPNSLMYIYIYMHILGLNLDMMCMLFSLPLLP